MSVEVSKEKIEGTELVFNFEVSSNEFTTYIELAEKYAKGKSLDECRRKARAILRAAVIKLAIPAHLVNVSPEEWQQMNSWDRPSRSSKQWAKKCNGVYPIILRGLDARNDRDVLIEYEDGTREKVKQYSWDRDGELVRRLTKAEEDEYRKLHAAKAKADTEFESWMDEHRIKEPEQFVAEAIQKKIDEANAGDAAAEPTGDPRVDAGTGTGKRRRSNRTHS